MCLKEFLRKINCFNFKVFMLTVLIICILLKYLPMATSEVYNSLQSMEKLIKTEEYVMKSIKSYLPQVNGPLNKNKIKDYLASCAKEHKIAIKNVTNYLGNPINAFRLIKRLTQDLRDVEDILKENTYYIRSNKLTYPTVEDLQGAIKGLLHLKVIYDLNVTDLANGTLTSNVSRSQQTFTEYVTPMSASDCYELALAAQEYSEHHTAIAWMIEALRKYKHCVDCSFTELDAVNFIGRLYYIMGDYKNSLLWREKNITQQLSKQQVDENKNLIAHLRKLVDQKKLKNITEVSDLRMSKTHKEASKKKYLEILCNGENSKTVNNKSLHCHYKIGPQHYVRLMCFKVEQLHLSPDVVMYHDVFSDKEIEEFKRLTKPNMRTATVNEYEKSENFRVAQTGWVYNIISKTTKRISHRMSLLTGYVVNKYQKLEICNYGIGGFQSPHFDSRGNTSSICVKNKTILMDEEEWRQMPGKATLLLYLSDVEQGGATIFAKLGLTVFPKKNAAVLWHNYHHRIATMDLMMLHAACPVLRGDKWSKDYRKLCGRENYITFTD